MIHEPRPAEAGKCWCCGVSTPCRCERAGRCAECGWCREHCRVLPARAAMSAPTGELLCGLVTSVAGSTPLEVEFVADADARKGWLVRAWLEDGSLRDYRLHPAELAAGLADDALPERLIESRFERWPPAEIRGRIQRCRC